jgi:predicted lipoprotein with Yx(FWY)xxD motif
VIRKARLLGSALLVVVSLALAACGNQPAASSTPTPTPTPAPKAVVEVREAGTLGTILVAANGMTLYKFANDKPGVSNCKDACATRWPVLTAPAGKLVGGLGVTGTLATITRADGLTQVTYKDLPLYFYAPDTAPGDTKGQGVGGVWFVVNP